MTVLRQLTRYENSDSGRLHDRAVTINYFNEQLSLDPPCPEIVAALSTVSRVAVPDAEHGYRLAARRESLLAPRVPRPNAGLLLAVYRLLCQAGHKQGTFQQVVGAAIALARPG